MNEPKNDEDESDQSPVPKTPVSSFHELPISDREDTAKPLNVQELAEALSQSANG